MPEVLKTNPLSNEAVQKVYASAKRRACKIYLVGGYIRDAILSKPDAQLEHKDYDFMVMGSDAVGLARQVADDLNGHFVMLDEGQDTARVVTDDASSFDFAGCVGGSLEADMKRRDFTVNALSWDADDPDNVIDLVNGISDLERKKIRAISEQSFLDDPLRLLRAYRFAARLNFDIDDECSAYICKHANLISTVAAERICAELFMMLESPLSGKYVRLMGDNGLLEAIFPELKETRRVTSNAFHHLPLFDHSVESLVQAEAAYPSMPGWVQEGMREPLSAGVSRLAATKLAALIHDIGKPDTWVITEEGKHTFIGHDKLGAEMCEPLAKRLKWSKPVERFIEKLVRWHLRPGHLFQQGMPTDKAKYRFYRAIGDELPELIVLALADFRSTCGPGLQVGRREAEENLFELLRNFSVIQVGKAKESRFLNGTDLMNLLGISPGPVIGNILEDLLEAQALGEVKSPEDASSLAKKLYREKYCKNQRSLGN